MALVNPLSQLNGILSQMVAGQLESAAAGSAVLEHLAPVEASGVLHPDDAHDLRRLAEGETLQPGRLAEIAARTGLLYAVASAQVPPQDMYDRYLRIVGGSTPSLLPSSLRPRTSRAIQIRSRSFTVNPYTFPDNRTCG